MKTYIDAVCVHASTAACDRHPVPRRLCTNFEGTLLNQIEFELEQEGQWTDRTKLSGNAVSTIFPHDTTT